MPKKADIQTEQPTAADTAVTAAAKTRKTNAAGTKTKRSDKADKADKANNVEGQTKRTASSRAGAKRSSKIDKTDAQTKSAATSSKGVKRSVGVGTKAKMADGGGSGDAGSEDDTKDIDDAASASGMDSTENACVAKQHGDNAERSDDAAELPSGIPTVMESEFFNTPDYEWPEEPAPGKNAGIRNLFARMRRDVDAWHFEREASKSSKASVSDAAPSASIVAHDKGVQPMYDAKTLLPPSPVAKKRNPLLLAGVAVFAVALLGLAALGLYTLVTANILVNAPTADTASSTTAAIKLPASRTKDATIPNLSVLPGLSTDDALAYLGDGWQIDDGSYTRNDANAAAVSEQTQRIVYAPSFSATSDGAAILAVVSDTGQIRALTFTAPLEVLGYPNTDFYNLISDQGLIVAALSRAGISPLEKELVVPAQSDTEEYRFPDDKESGVYQRTWTFTGRGSGAREDIWLFTLTYNYGLGEYSEADDSGQASGTALAGASDEAPLRIMEIGIY